MRIIPYKVKHTGGYIVRVHGPYNNANAMESGLQYR